MKVNVENLTILREHMKTVPEEKFFIKHFISKNYSYCDRRITNIKSFLNECGSSGCILGHAASKFPLHGIYNFDDISEKILGIECFIECRRNPLWAFLFGTQNSDSIAHAIERLDLVIKENS